MVSIRDVGLLAEAVYDANPTAAGWNRTNFHPATSSLNGFQAATFNNGTYTVIAFRGTAQAMDAAADLKLGAGMNSTYFAAGDSYANSLRGHNHVFVCGHSLGGAIAQVVANRGGFKMLSFNAPGVAVLASRNMGSSTVGMNAIRVGGMLLSAIRHPSQAIDDMTSAFNVVEGLNVCLANDVVSMIGNHYGEVVRIPGTSSNPLTEHGISTMNTVLLTNSLGSRSIATL